MSEQVTCPFCQESDFDLEGLDNHLYRYCEKYGGMHAQAARVDRLEAENQRLKAELEQRRLFPCQNGPSVPWSIIAPHEAQAMKNHDQDLRMLASRGGCSACEIVAILMDRKWKAMPDDEAREQIYAFIAERTGRRP